VQTNKPLKRLKTNDPKNAVGELARQDRRIEPKKTRIQGGLGTEQIVSAT
jgi:hypothetical protein